MWPRCPVDPSRDCSCPGWVTRGGLSFQSWETVEEEASPRPCRGDLGARVGRAVCYPDQPHCLELEEEPRAGGGQLSASDLPGPEPSRHPPAFGQWERTSWSKPWPAAGAQFCVPAWWDRVGTATLGPQSTCQEGSDSWGWRTEHVSKGAVAPGSLKTSGVGLGSSIRCLLMKVLCCILLQMGNLTS